MLHKKKNKSQIGLWITQEWECTHVVLIFENILFKIYYIYIINI